jgi:hypothetical protein
MIDKDQAVPELPLVLIEWSISVAFSASPTAAVAMWLLLIAFDMAGSVKTQTG